MATSPVKRPRRTRASRALQTKSESTPFVARIVDEGSLGQALERLPTEPGVYIMRDRLGEVVYVGKARSLKARVRQYFSGHDTRYFVPVLAEILGDLETIVTSNEKEALLLENNLIKKHRPRFNVKLRDDKQYLVLRLDPNGTWPRLEVVRNMKDDQAHYFGPYHSAQSARSTLRVINRHFRLRTCTDFVLTRRKRPCLQYQIGRCPAPCVLEVDVQSYREQVEGAALFLAGRHEALSESLRANMEAAAERLDFERASQIRDQLRAIETTLSTQHMVGSASVDQDAIGMYRQGGLVEFVVVQVRSGKVIGTQAFSERGMEHPDIELLHGFLCAYYERSPSVPDEILLAHALDLDDAGPLQEWLSERHRRACTILVPSEGDRERLVALATKNAASSFLSRRNRVDDQEALLARIQKRFSLSRLPRRIECFDISHLQGSDTVASMVTFVDGQPEKSLYRRFVIRGQDGELAQRFRQNDDFASMYEVISRRVRRALEENDESWALPDLIVIDGGKGQLAQAVAAVQDLGVGLGIDGVDLISLAKERKSAIGLHQGKKALAKLRAFKREQIESGQRHELPGGSSTIGQTFADFVVGVNSGEANAQPDAPARAAELFAAQNSEPLILAGSLDPEIDDDIVHRPERVFLAGARDSIALREGSSELHLLARLRDEAHRFAITHHRTRRSKRALESSLDDLKGVASTVKKELIARFGSVQGIREADEESLRSVPGVGTAVIRRIREGLS
jgi:excinuclease ABC subunit C